jgi:hypothetical protein
MQKIGFLLWARIRVVAALLFCLPNNSRWAPAEKGAFFWPQSKTRLQYFFARGFGNPSATLIEH